MEVKKKWFKEVQVIAEKQNYVISDIEDLKISEMYEDICSSRCMKANHFWMRKNIPTLKKTFIGIGEAQNPETRPKSLLKLI